MAISEKAEVEVRINSKEAKEALQTLEKQAGRLKRELEDAIESKKDPKEIRKIQRELRNVNKEIRTIQNDTVSLNQVIKNLSDATPKELRATLQAINRELNSGAVERGSEQWKYYQEQVKLVNAELRTIQQETQESKGWLDKFNDGFARWGTLLGTATAALTGFGMVFNQFRKQRDDEEEARANLESLTGLDKDSIGWLQKKAEELSTSMHASGLRVRQSAEEIIQAYMAVGSKKPELLSSKEALNEVTIEAMRLASAAGIDLKEAVNAVAVSLNMYSEDASQAAKYVNILAAGSQKGAATVASQAEAIVNAGVAAASAKVPMEALQGSIQMLAEKGIEGSNAGTALKKFFLVLQTGADETNPKVVGFEKALANLSAQGLTAADIQKKFGEEGFTAASILIDNVDKVNDYTKAVTGTNVAVEQAAINSDTANAKLAQYKNEMNRAGVELAQRLNPAFLKLTGLTKKFVVALPAVIDWFKEYGSAVIAASVAVGVYTAAVKAAAIKTALLDRWNKIAAVSQAALNAVMNANPAHLVIGAIAGLTAYLAAKFIPTTNKAAESQAELNDELEKTREKEDKLLDIRKRYASMDKMNERQQQQLKQDAEALLHEVEDRILKEQTAAKKNYTVISFLVQKKKELESIIASVPEGKGGTAVTAPADPKEAGKAEDSRHLEYMNDIKRMYLEEKITRDEYLKLAEDAEMQHLQRMLAIAGMETQERQKIQEKILQAKIAYKEKCLEEDKKEAEERRKEENEARVQGFEEEREAIAMNHYRQMTDEEEFRNELKDAERAFLTGMLAEANLTKEERLKYQQQYNKLELDEEKRKYEERKKQEKETEKMNQRYISLARGIASEYGTTIGDMIANGQLTMHNFLKETLNMALDALEKVIEITAVEIIAKNAAATAPLSFIGIAKAAAQIAAIKAAFAIAKGLIANFDVGGYTGDGRWDEPKGIVHAGEFVANRHAVANPAVKPVLDLIDTAQKNNTVGALTGSDFASVMYGVPATTVPAAAGNRESTQADPELHALLVSLNRLTARLNIRLKDKISAEVPLEGKKGLHAAEERYNRLQKNISRFR